jgi:hypothetical protein
MYDPHMDNALNIISQIILDNQLYILPLYSIREGGGCSCGNPLCSSPGKHPLFRYNWKIIASNKPEKVKEWLSAHKKMNFGLATGRYSKTTGKYLVVIDVDATEHPILNELPTTFSYRTGSGGHHLWFWSPYPIKNSVSLLAEKVDVRGTDGYVVIPPSNHRKGKYDGINNLPIADLPKEYISKLLAHKQTTATSTPRKTKAKTQQLAATTVSVWVTEPVSKIRQMMSTQLVPEGIRNVVMHRLLCSDRARGALKSQLRKNAWTYVKSFSNPVDFGVELERIIDSVMRYPAYNNSHEKVNELYVSWLKKNRRIKLEPAEVKSLTSTDSAFFALLRPADPKLHRCSLQQVLDARMAYMQTAGLSHISNYKTQLLAKKLTELGFSRTRTAKGNWWNVDMSGIVPASP